MSSYTTLHYSTVTLHYTDYNYNKKLQQQLELQLPYSTLHKLHYTHYTTPRYATLGYPNYTTLYSIPLHFHSTSLHYTPLTTLHDTSLQ